MTEKQALKAGYVIQRGNNYGGKYVGNPPEDNANQWYVDKVGEPTRRFRGFFTKKEALKALARRLERAREAGSVRSEAKAASSRANGSAGGRPADPEIKQIMAERGCSRQRAHQILRSRVIAS